MVLPHTFGRSPMADPPARHSGARIAAGAIIAALCWPGNVHGRGLFRPVTPSRTRRMVAPVWPERTKQPQQARADSAAGEREVGRRTVRRGEPAAAAEEGLLPDGARAPHGGVGVGQMELFDAGGVHLGAHPHLQLLASGHLLGGDPQVIGFHAGPADHSGQRQKKGGGQFGFHVLVTRCALSERSSTGAEKKFSRAFCRRGSCLSAPAH